MLIDENKWPFALLIRNMFDYFVLISVAVMLSRQIPYNKNTIDAELIKVKV